MVGYGRNMLKRCQCALSHMDDNQREEELLEYLPGTDLEVINERAESTFITINRREALDITLCSQRIRTRFKDWSMSDEASFSDHRIRIRESLGLLVELLRGYIAVGHTPAGW